jgi:ATP-dependent helicase YprA (DUF1998 family)
MNVFDFRNRLMEDYSSYVRSFITIQDNRIRDYVDETVGKGELWPEPLIQLNPSFEPGRFIDDLVKEGTLQSECSKIFRAEKDENDDGRALRLHKHQEEAIRVAQRNRNYVLTTGTGSGKSLAYIIPIVNAVLKKGSRKGIQAIVIYPMNALANSQIGELKKFLKFGYPENQEPAKKAMKIGIRF